MPVAKVPQPDEHMVTKTTTFREVLPPGGTDPGGGRKQPEFFEFVRSMPEQELGNFTIYLYRTEPGRIQIDHTPGKTFDVPGVGLVPITNLEPIETVVGDTCGGGIFR